MNLFDAYETISVGVPETIEGFETVHLVMRDDQGQEEHWFFKENGDLFQKIRWVASGPESAYESTERFYDFKTLDGFRFPGTIRFYHPSHSAELKIELCTVNPDFDPSIFDLPEESR